MPNIPSTLTYERMIIRKWFDKRRLLRHTPEQKRFLRIWQGTALTSELPNLEFGPHLGSGSFVSPHAHSCVHTEPHLPLASGAPLLQTVVNGRLLMQIVAELLVLAFCNPWSKGAVIAPHPVCRGVLFVRAGGARRWLSSASTTRAQEAQIWQCLGRSWLGRSWAIPIW